MSVNPAPPVSRTSRDRQRLETREKVFEAAIGEFRRSGFDQSQIDDIVKAAGVARGTFYFHFPTRDHVLLELLKRLQTEAAVAVERRGAVRNSVRGYLTNFSNALVAAVGQLERMGLRRELFAVVVRRSGELELEDLPVVQVLLSFFAAAQEHDEVRSDLTPDDMTTSFLTGIFGILLTMSGSGERRLRAAVAGVVDVFVRGLAP